MFMMENNNYHRPVRMPPTPQKRRKVPKWKRFLRRYGFYIVSALILAAVVLGIVLMLFGLVIIAIAFTQK